MAVTRLIFNGNVGNLRKLLAYIPRLLSGKSADIGMVVRGMQLRVASQALSIVKDSFVVKAQGKKDDAGLQWKPLAPSTIARRRISQKDQKLLSNKARTAQLTTAQLKVYQKTYRETRAKIILRGGDDKSARRYAQTTATEMARRAGGVIQTTREILAGRKVEILRDTGLLLNSLSPALDHGETFLRVRPGRVGVGTNILYATKHHHGAGICPQRPLWANPTSWPPPWMKLLHRQLIRGIMSLILYYGNNRGFPLSFGDMPGIKIKAV